MSFLTRRIVISTDREVAFMRRLAELCRTFFSTARPLGRLSPTGSKRELATVLDDLDRIHGITPPVGRYPGDAPNDAAFLLLDGSAIVALGRGHAEARMRLRDALMFGARVLVAASTLADPRVAAVAERFATVVEIDDRIGNDAARLVAETRLTLPLDALTVACAPLGVRVAILTTDPTGVGALVRASGRTDLKVIALGRRLRRG